MRIQGVLPVLPTPFGEDGGIDRSAMQQIVRFCLDARVSGMVFPGFASEVSDLTAAERQELLETVASIAPPSVSLIAGISAETAPASIGFGKSAAKLGVDHLMIQPPPGLGSEFRPVSEFLEEVVRGLPNSRIILQNAPAPRGADISPDTIVKLAASFPQIAYVKEESLPSGPAITYILEHKPVSLEGAIGGGGARYVLDEYARGACAVMPAVEIADLHVEMTEAWQSGDTARARELYVRTLPLLTLQTVYRMRLTKHVLARRGLNITSVVRAPTPLADQFALDDIDENLRELNLIDGRQSGQGSARERHSQIG